MLSVILLILRIIGIAILILLGLILLLILTVLFVPIRYRVKVEHGDSFAVDGGISWLLHLVHAKIRQTDKDRRIWIRVLGVLIYDSLRPPKAKKKRVKDISKAKRDTRANSRHKTESEIKIEDVQKSEADIKAKDVQKAEADIKAEDVQKSETVLKAENLQESEADTKLDNVQKADMDIETDDIRESKKSLKKIYIKVKTKIINFFKKIKNKLKDLILKLLNIKNKVNLILSFIRDDINKEGFRFTYRSIKKIIKHILPRKLKSKLIFGTGDPCSTGQALGVLGVLYSIYGDNLQITPDFENKVLKGSHYARGRIRIWTILIIVIKFLLDKRFKELKMSYQQLKEAL